MKRVYYYNLGKKHAKAIKDENDIGLNLYNFPSGVLLDELGKYERKRSAVFNKRSLKSRRYRWFIFRKNTSVGEDMKGSLDHLINGFDTMIVDFLNWSRGIKPTSHEYRLNLLGLSLDERRKDLEQYIDIIAQMKKEIPAESLDKLERLKKKLELKICGEERDIFAKIIDVLNEQKYLIELTQMHLLDIMKGKCFFRLNRYWSGVCKARSRQDAKMENSLVFEEFLEKTQCSILGRDYDEKLVEIKEAQKSYAEKKDSLQAVGIIDALIK